MNGAAAGDARTTNFAVRIRRVRRPPVSRILGPWPYLCIFAFYS